MNSILKTVRFSLVLLTALAVSVAAQSYGKPAVDNRPFTFGETLTYEGKISKIVQGITVADLTFVIGKAAGSNNFVITGHAKSKGTLIRLFGFSFVQDYESTIDANSFKALKSTHHDVQKDRVRDSEADFDYAEKRVTYTETDPKSSMRAPRKIASSIDGPTHDLISGLYSLRLLPLAVGKTFDVKVSDSGLVYDIPVKVTAREEQKSIFGKVWCWRVEPDVFGPGRLIEKEGKMIIWIVDDARRIPVRAQIDSAFKLEIKLRKTANLK